MTNILRKLLWVLVVFVIGCGELTYEGNLPNKLLLPKDKIAKSAKILWQTKISGGYDKNIANFNFSGIQNNLIAADNKGNIIAVSSKDGKIVWQRNVSSGVNSGPVVSGNNIAIIDKYNSLLWLNKQSDLLWSTKLPSDSYALPAVGKDNIYVISADGKLLSYSKLNGKLMQQYSQPLPSLVLRTSGRVACYPNNVLAGFANGKLISLNSQTFAENWSQQISIESGNNEWQRMTDINAAPLVVNEVVYAIGYHGNLKAIQADNGEVLWTQQVGALQDFTYANKNLYISTTAGQVVAVDSATGRILWQQTLLQGRNLTKPVLFRNKLILVDELGNLFVLQQKTGDLEYYFPTIIAGGAISAPIVKQDKLYVLSVSGYILNIGLVE